MNNRAKITILMITIACRYSTASTGQFLHISDFHLDLDFSLHGFPNYYCHVYPNGSESTHEINSLGNHACDSPYGLVENSIENMAKFFPKPDFILWTGDSSAHVPDSTMNTSKIIISIQNITDNIKHYFPGIPVYPVLGNHDYWPANQFSGEPNEVYTGTAELWKSWLSDDAYQSYKINGYYMMDLIGSTKTKILALNTNMYKSIDDFAVKADDPGNQFRYMEDQLAKARSSGWKVWILAHIAPGPGEDNMGKCYNERYLKIIRKYNDVIVAGFYAHDHTDEFRLLSHSADNGTYINFFLLAPAITAWDYYNNPSFRIVDFDRDSFKLNDITQIYLNLTDAITNNYADWTYEYSFKRAYGVDEITTESLSGLYKKMKEDANFRFLYSKHRTALYGVDKCDVTCQKNNLCEIGFQDKQNYADCLTKQPKTPTGSGHRTLGPLGLVICLLGFSYYC